MEMGTKWTKLHEEMRDCEFGDLDKDKEKENIESVLDMIASRETLLHVYVHVHGNRPWYEQDEHKYKMGITTTKKM